MTGCAQGNVPPGPHGPCQSSRVRQARQQEMFLYKSETGKRAIKTWGLPLLFSRESVILECVRCTFMAIISGTSGIGCLLSERPGPHEALI